ncbi:MAG: hemolysin family protein [Planctomycetota bacterium]
MTAFLAAEGARLAVMAGLLMLSGFFSGAETALFSLGRDELDALLARHPRRGAAARRLLSDPEGLLVSILFGNLVVNTLYFALSAAIAIRASEAHGGAAAAGVSTGALVALLLFGEILPKAIAAGSPSGVSSFMSIPLWLFDRVLGRPAGIVASPALAVVNWIARSRAEAVEPDELRMLVDLAGRSGALSGTEAEMIDGVVELSDLRAREVMVPRVDVVFASVSERPEQVLRRLRGERRSRAPVYDGPVDNIVGVVEACDLVASVSSGRKAEDLQGFVRPIDVVPESARLSSVLKRVRDEGLEVAVVVDEYGGTAGLVTLDDLAEAVLGDVGAGAAPSAEAPAVEQTPSGSYVLSGGLSVRDWAELFEVEPEPGQFDTLGGFVAFLLGRIPKEGDVAAWENLRFAVREMRGRRVARVELMLEGGAG